MQVNVTHSPVSAASGCTSSTGNPWIRKTAADVKPWEDVQVGQTHSSGFTFGSCRPDFGICEVDDVEYLEYWSAPLVVDRPLADQIREQPLCSPSSRPMAPLLVRPSQLKWTESYASGWAGHPEHCWASSVGADVCVCVPMGPWENQEEDAPHWGPGGRPLQTYFPPPLPPSPSAVCPERPTTTTKQK